MIMEDKMKYTGAKMWGCYKPDPNVRAEVSGIDLTDVPEDIVNNKVLPLITELADILEPYHTYIWLTRGYSNLNEWKENQENITE